MIKSVQNLIDSGKGDPKRLTEILHALEQKSPLYMTDYKYLESLTSKNEMQNIPDLKNKIKEIKQKVQTLKQKPRSENVIDSSLSILKTRLASGEITLDEFNAIKKTLKER